MSRDTPLYIGILLVVLSLLVAALAIALLAAPSPGRAGTAVLAGEGEDGGGDNTTPPAPPSFTALDLWGVVLLGISVAGIGGALYSFSGSDSSSDLDTASNVGDAGATVYGAKRSSKGHRAKHRSSKRPRRKGQ